MRVEVRDVITCIYKFYLLPATAEYLHVLLHVSAELLSRHNGLIYRHKQRAACH
jgi:hypothetical protein